MKGLNERSSHGWRAIVWPDGGGVLIENLPDALASLRAQRVTVYAPDGNVLTQAIIREPLQLFNVPWIGHADD